MFQKYPPTYLYKYIFIFISVHSESRMEIKDYSKLKMKIGKESLEKKYQKECFKGTVFVISSESPRKDGNA